MSVRARETTSPGPWLTLLTAALILSGLTAPAAAGVVLLVRSASLGPYTATIQGFRAAYRGEVVEVSLDEASPNALERRLRDARPDVMVAIGLRASMFVHERFPRTPMVFCVVQNFDRHSLSGGWVTGVATDVSPAAELTALHRVAPDVARVGLLVGPGTGADALRQIRAAAAAVGMTVVEALVDDVTDLPARARELAEHADALWMLPDPAVATPEAFRFLLDLSIRRGRPLLAFSEALVRAGALVAVTPDYDWVGAQAAEAVRRIQSGERAGDIAVIPLKRTRVVVNESTARALGRELPVTALGEIEVLR